MKNNLFRNCAYVSAILFFGFIGLYAYVWFADFNPKESDPDKGWRSISIGHGTVSIAHSSQPSTRTNGPAMLTYPEDGGGNFHITVAKDFTKEMGGCYLVFLNQNMPSEGMMFLFTDGDSRTNETQFIGYGIGYVSFKHTGRMIESSDDDRTSETYFKSYGIFLRDINHTVDKAHNWWTLMISLWYPIIIFGILPLMFLEKKLRTAKVSVW